MSAQRTPKDIAFKVESAVNDSPSFPIFTFRESQAIHRLVLAAVREAQADSEAGFKLLGATIQSQEYALQDAHAALHPDFAPTGEPDKFRDLWADNMPRVSECMYFSIPGEQPIHLPDDLARFILATLSKEA